MLDCGETMITRHLDWGCGPSPRHPCTRDEVHAVDLVASEGMAPRLFGQANLRLEPIPYPDSTVDAALKPGGLLCPPASSDLSRSHPCERHDQGSSRVLLWRSTACSHVRLLRGLQKIAQRLGHAPRRLCAQLSFWLAPQVSVLASQTRRPPVSPRVGSCLRQALPLRRA
jgi:hypothetical protein